MLLISFTYLFLLLFLLLFTEVRLQKDEAVEGAWRLWLNRKRRSVFCVCEVLCHSAGDPVSGEVFCLCSVTDQN